jgi:hyperosmotically inducible protein
MLRCRLVLGCTVVVLASIALAACAGDPTPKATAQSHQRDDMLNTHINAVVTAVPGIHPSSVRLATRDGMVILFGTANDPVAAANAAQAAAQIEGVKAVDYDIRIDPFPSMAGLAPLTTTYSSRWVQPMD